MATDTAGNKEDASIEGITTSTILSSLSIDFPTDGTTIDTDAVTVSGTASDTDSGINKVEVSVDDGPFNVVLRNSYFNWYSINLL